MHKHFVTFLSPGTFVSEETTKEIDSWDVEKAQEMSKKITERYGAKPYCFYFSTRERADNELDSKVTKTSHKYFLGVRAMTLKDVEKEMPKEEILIAKMKCNGIKHVIVNDNSWRIVQPFEDGDILLENK